jgi:hypothetical protein
MEAPSWRTQAGNQQRDRVNFVRIVGPLHRVTYIHGDLAGKKKLA